MARFKIPPPLQKFTDGKNSIELEASSLSEALSSLDKSYPGFKKSILSDTQEIKRFVSIFVDNENVQYLEGLKTKLESKSSVVILIAMAGG